MVLCRFLHFTAVLMVFGAWAFKPLLLGSQTLLEPALTRAARWLAAVALVTGVGWLLLTTASMAGDWAAAFDPSTLRLVLADTFFGQVWLWHLLLCVALLALLFTPWRAHLPARLILSSLVLATLAPVGHGAMFDGLRGQLLILNQLVHLIAVGAWLGGLMLLVMVLHQPADHPIGDILRQFSGVGYLLVTALVITGLINVRALTGQFWPTPMLSGFALILLVKVLFVVAMLGLALFNRLRVADAQLRLPALKTSVTLEWLLGMGAVAAVSQLGTLAPMVAH